MGAGFSNSHPNYLRFYLMDFFQPIQLTVLTQLILLILLTLPIQQTVLILRNLPNLQTRAIQANQVIRVNQQIL